MKLKLVLLFFILFTSTVQAAPIKNDKLNNDPQDLNIPLSPSQIDVEIENDVIQRDRASQPNTQIELGVSSWQPKNLQAPAYSNAVSGFSVQNAPDLNLSVLIPINTMLNFNVGGSFLTVSRSSNLVSPGLSSSQDQTGYLPSVRVGVEYQPQYFGSRVFHPYAQFSLLPSLFITNRSGIDAGESTFGLPVQLGAGVLISFTKIMALNLGVSQVWGSAGDSDLAGFGVNAGVRVAL